MTDVDETIDRRIAVWNEIDSDRRRSLIVQTWTEDAGLPATSIRSRAARSTTASTP